MFRTLCDFETGHPSLLQKNKYDIQIQHKNQTGAFSFETSLDRFRKAFRNETNLSALGTDKLVS